MKCENCIALENVGTYEYPEYDCIFGEDYAIEFKDCTCGCRRTSLKRLEKDIKRLRQEEVKSWEKYIKTL
ncbi:MAG: hypothetical protein RR585_01805 [Coprobacillus sp.]